MYTDIFNLSDKGDAMPSVACCAYIPLFWKLPEDGTPMSKLVRV
jgi:hypothetical protein